MATVSEWPEGTVTFLFTDVEGSTQRWEQHTAAMRHALRRHDDLLRETIEARGGVVFKTIGDEFCAAFPTAPAALAAAIEIQRALQAERWGETGPLRVRIALHTGEPEFRDQDYFGPDLSRVARLLTAGHGGQVLLSGVTAKHVRSALPEHAHLRFLGEHRLRNLTAREPIYQLQLPGLPADFPPLNTLDVAFRRGLKRALAIAAVVVAALGALLVRSMHETRRANANAESVLRMLTLDEAERGVKKLENNDGLGLLDLLQAREHAETLPDLREAVSTLWAGWHQAYEGRLINAVGHKDAVLDLKYSPDGRLLATASADKTVKLWSTHTWELALPPLQHDKPVRLVRFSADSKMLATVAGNHARLWDTTTGKPLSRPLPHEVREEVGDLAFSPDGKWLATAAEDRVWLWDAKTGRPHGRPLRQDDTWVSVGFEPGTGSVLVVASHHSVSLWNTATGTRVGQLLPGKPAPSWKLVLAFGRDGGVRAIGGNEAVWLWDGTKGQFRLIPLPRSGVIEALALSPDGRVLATVPYNGARIPWRAPAVQLWETATGRRAMPSLPHPAGVNALAFSPCSKILLATLCEGVVRLWDTSTGEPYPEPPPSPGTAGKSFLEVSPDGKTVAIVPAQGTVHLWALAAPRPYQRLPLASAPLCMAFLDDDRVLATYSESDARDNLRLWSTDTARLLRRPKGVPGKIGSAFSSDGSLFVQWGGRTVSVWETETGRQHGSPLHLPQRVRYAALSPRGTMLAIISPFDTVQLWDAAGSRSRGALLHHPASVVTFEFSPDERLLATAAVDGVRLWETAAHRLRTPPIRVAGRPQWIAFSPDGRLLALATEHGSALTLYSTATGRPFGPGLEHLVQVRGEAFSPDGKRLATVTGDNTVWVWDLASRSLSGKSMPQPDTIEAVRFSPDGKLLATASFSGARLWDVTTGQLATRPLVTREPVWDVQFGHKGRILALRTDQAVYLWPLPVAPAGLPEMRRQTEVVLGAAPVPGGGTRSLTWQQWREQLAPSPPAPRSRQALTPRPPLGPAANVRSDKAGRELYPKTAGRGGSGGR